MKCVLTALCAGVCACALGIGGNAARAQTVELTGDLPGCSAGQTSVTLTYSGVDVRVAPGGVRLNCNTTIVVKGGDLTVDGVVQGMTPHEEPRPDGQDGNNSYSLTLITQCGRRSLIAADIPMVFARPSQGTPDAIDPSFDVIAPRTFCGTINVNAFVNLVGEPGTDGRAAESAGTGFAGGNGGNGGSFSAIGVNDINLNAIIDTSGGQGGNGGPGGPDTSCEAAGQGNGGWGASGGSAGSISASHSGAANTAVIRIGSGLYRGLYAIGGSAGNGGWATFGAQHGCGATAGAGGSAANGRPGGTVSISGLRVESSIGYSSGHPIPVINTSGGNGGSAGNGASGGDVLCEFVGRGPSCPPPLNGGAAGNAGSGGNGGGVAVKGTGTPLSATDPGTFQGSIYIYSRGGTGGTGASGGSAGLQVIPPGCSNYCCGSGGFSQAGDIGGAGGNASVSGTRISLYAQAELVGGNGGWGTRGSSGRCGDCDGEQGGLGGAGGAGGSFTFSGKNPFVSSSIAAALWGGSGGWGGPAGPGGPAAPGGTAGSAGTITNSATPPASVSFYLTPGVPGEEGEDGLPCPPLP